MWSKIWKAAALPLILLAMVAALYAAWLLIDVPSEQQLMPIARGYFERYGLWTVFVAAILEGLVVIGWYFPGVFIIVFALLLSGHNISRLAEVVTSALLGLCVAYAINYLAGRFGWYRLLIAFGLKEPLEKARARLNKYGLPAVFTTYWQINLASVLSTAAGVLRFPFLRFVLLSCLAAALWLCFWTVVIVALGQGALALVSLRVIFVAILCWLVLRLLLQWRARKPL